MYDGVHLTRRRMCAVITARIASSELCLLSASIIKWLVRILHDMWRATRRGRKCHWVAQFTSKPFSVCLLLHSHADVVAETVRALAAFPSEKSWVRRPAKSHQLIPKLIPTTF